MAKTSAAVQEINGILQPSDEARFVTDKYVTWRGSQQTWLALTKELRNYIFQTDTTQTTNKNLPWKNTTSLPKLTQLRDNLQANYAAALFPHDNWFKWEAAEQDAASRENVRIIEAYMLQKIRESSFKQTIGKALYDYIDYGNAFGEVTYVNSVATLPDGAKVSTYTGPRVHRISPYDIYFDISASDFDSAAKITRRIVSMGSLKKAFEEDPLGFAWVPDALKSTIDIRTRLNSFGDSDLDKSEGLVSDGFGSISQYYSSDMVELLEFEGDMFNSDTGELKSNYRVIVMDRKEVVHQGPIESWLGKSNKEHVGWRERPDNLYAAGPLDNLVGMQYRIDHLENLKADVFDMIAHPIVYQRGLVEQWEYGPGERIFGDTDSSVDFIRPDATALNADFQIETLMRNMEDFAGAPREAMGIRTPGEKTAFEVQSLENAAGRIFQQKIQKFEEDFVEPLLNQMLEAARRNISPSEIVKVLDEDLAITEFLTITPEIINSRGKLYPIGARHFAKQAQLVQNLTQFTNSAAYADPAVNAHISGRRIAELYEENLGLGKFELVQDNIRIAEQQNTQSLTAQAQENVVGEIADRSVNDEGGPSGL